MGRTGSAGCLNPTTGANDGVEPQRYAWTMTDARQVIDEEETLDAEDRVWLYEQLDRYSELLTYLREH